MNLATDSRPVEQTSKSISSASSEHTRRLWPLLALALTVVCVAARTNAQDNNPLGQTNDVAQSEAVDTTSDDTGTTDDLEATNQVSESNSVGQAAARGPDGRTRRLQRQRRPHRIAPGQNGSGLASTNGVGPLDYAAFRLITERNIFDPNRQPHTPGSRSQPKAQDSVTLVGTMSYEKGDFAFFDGTSPDYKKVCKPAETIAGYKVLSISPDSVKLERDSKNLELPVGSHLRHQEDGSWVKVAGAAAYAASTETSSSSETDTASRGADNDILKRLMQRREKENSP